MPTRKEEIGEYLAKHDVQARLDVALNTVIKAKADDPIKYIGQLLLQVKPPADALPAAAVALNGQPPAEHLAKHDVEAQICAALHKAITAKADDPIKYIGETLLQSKPPADASTAVATDWASAQSPLKVSSFVLD